MARTSKTLWNWLALNLQGDLADYTCYKAARGDIVFFPKHPPEVPRSLRQAWRRDLFRAAANAWQSLGSPTRANWERATKLAHLGITGYNLWTFWYVTEDQAAIRTIERQSGVTLL